MTIARPPLLALFVSACAAGALALGACSSGADTSPDPAPAAMRAKPAAGPTPGLTTTSSTAGIARTIDSGGSIRHVQPWSFDGESGQAVTTDHFQIYITEKNPMIAQRLPGFLEAALDHYTHALGTLPTPRDRMETFVMGSRAQWKRLVLTMLGNKGQAAASSIQRGGMTFGGRAYLFDIGSADTLSLAAHEGWHQYTQRTFAEPLPVWLEEGIATYMEGHRWTGPSVTFSGWSNVERFDQLRMVVATRNVIALADLLTSSPNQLVEHGAAGDALTYYAQVWGLVHFLREGEGGRYRAGLQRLLSDASSGRMSQTVSIELRSQGLPAPRALGQRVGSQVFQAYFGADVARIDAEYRAFIARATETGARQEVVAGVSPLMGE